MTRWFIAVMIPGHAAISTSMSNHLDPYAPLPCRADRQKLIKQAELVLTDARALAEQWDQTFALLSAERPLPDTLSLSTARIRITDSMG